MIAINLANSSPAPAGRMIIARYVSEGALRALRNKWREKEKKNSFLTAVGLRAA
jgi:hypothetical protein